MIVVSNFLQDEVTLLGPSLSWTRSRLKEFLNIGLFRHMQQPPPPPDLYCSMWGRAAAYPFVDGEEPPPRGDALRDTPDDLRLYWDTPRSGWGAHRLYQVSTWTMVETGYLATRHRLGVESLLLTLQTFQYMVTVHRVTAMYDTSAVVTGPSGSPRERLPSPLEQPRHVCVPPPPLHLGRRVVAWIRETQDLSMTLVAPLGPEKAWFADLLLLLTQPPLTLLLWDRLLRQLHFHRFHRGVRDLNLHAWRLSSVSSESRVFRERLHARCPKCIRESTARLYQSQWLSFYNWCRQRGKTPIDATIPLIVDFLIHLRRDKGLSFSALKGYPTAINSVLALKGTDLFDSRELAMLFRGFAKSCPTTDLRPPAWDVALVLNSLTAAPYEPIKEAEERLLTHKKLFLLALASAKRVGELHALFHSVSHSVGWQEVSFSFVPGFVAKTQDRSSLDPRVESFMVPALQRSRDSPNGRLLCPVRAVKHYLSHTASHRPRCERLFVTSGRTKKEISFWLR